MKNANGKKIAFVMGRITPTKEDEAVEQLWQLDFVEYVQRTFGRFDFIAKLHFNDFQSFFEAYSQLKAVPELMPQKILIANSNKENLEMSA